MIEIISPSEPPSQLINKVEFYLQNGAKSVWLVDSKDRRIYIHALSRPMRHFGPGDTLTDSVLPGFDLPMSELFP